jgi:hypothetical protein
MRKALMTLVSTAALACATPTAAQEQAQVQPNYRPGDFVQGIGALFTWPLAVLVGPYEDLASWPASNCQRTQQYTGQAWRTVTVCN